MEIQYGLKGAARRRLAMAVADFVQADVHYKGPPGFEFTVGNTTIDMYGTLLVPRGFNARRLIRHLEQEGFRALATAEKPGETASGNAFSISMAELTDKGLTNLKTLISNKANLIKRSLDIDELPVEVVNGTVHFRWLLDEQDEDVRRACDHFLAALCRMAMTQKNIRPKEEWPANEKYAFRCFLLRLGFIGDEFAKDRKVLLEKLEGSAAFKNEQ